MMRRGILQRLFKSGDAEKQENPSEPVFAADDYGGVYLLGGPARLSLELFCPPAVFGMPGSGGLRGGRAHSPGASSPVGRQRSRRTAGGGCDGPRWMIPRPRSSGRSAPVGGPLPPATRLDLRREIGIRFHVRTDATDSDLTIQFHHACCDGAGFALFLRELLVAYALAYGNAPNRARLAELDPGKLAGRGRFGLTLGKAAPHGAAAARGPSRRTAIPDAQAGAADSPSRLSQRLPVAERLPGDGASPLRSGGHRRHAEGGNAPGSDLQRPLGPRLVPGDWPSGACGRISTTTAVGCG